MRKLKIPDIPKKFEHILPTFSFFLMSDQIFRNNRMAQNVIN